MFNNILIGFSAVEQISSKPSCYSSHRLWMFYLLDTSKANTLHSSAPKENMPRHVGRIPRQGIIAAHLLMRHERHPVPGKVHSSVAKEEAAKQQAMALRKRLLEPLNLKTEYGFLIFLPQNPTLSNWRTLRNSKFFSKRIKKVFSFRFQWVFVAPAVPQHPPRLASLDRRLARSKVLQQTSLERCTGLGTDHPWSRGPWVGWKNRKWRRKKQKREHFPEISRKWGFKNVGLVGFLSHI